jgi:hypothetical protein
MYTANATNKAIEYATRNAWSSIQWPVHTLCMLYMSVGNLWKRFAVTPTSSVPKNMKQNTVNHDVQNAPMLKMSIPVLILRTADREMWRDAKLMAARGKKSMHTNTSMQNSKKDSFIGACVKSGSPLQLVARRNSESGLKHTAVMVQTHIAYLHNGHFNTEMQ